VRHADQEKNNTAFIQLKLILENGHIRTRCGCRSPCPRVCVDTQRVVTVKKRLIQLEGERHGP
jgi:hypothetical protein